MKVGLAVALIVCAGTSNSAFADQPEGVDVDVTRSQCVIQGESYLLQQTYVSRKPVWGGAGKSWGPIYLINLTAPPGYKLYASNFRVEGEGRCADADSLDDKLNVLNRSAPGLNPVGTVAGLICGLHERDLSAKPASGTNLSYQWRNQGHQVAGHMFPFQIENGTDHRSYQKPPYTATINVYWEPIDTRTTCAVDKKGS